MSSLTFAGNLTHDPELRFTQAGHAVVSFSVAVANRHFDQATKSWVQDQPTFWRCVAWRATAENIAESLTKGTRVIITGKVTTKTWEKDGEQRNSLQVEVEEIGPSLRYATAKLTKNQRNNNGGDNWSNDDQANDNWVEIDDTEVL